MKTWCIIIFQPFIWSTVRWFEITILTVIRALVFGWMDEGGAGVAAECIVITEILVDGVVSLQLEGLCFHWWNPMDFPDLLQFGLRFLALNELNFVPLPCLLLQFLSGARSLL